MKSNENQSDFKIKYIYQQVLNHLGITSAEISENTELEPYLYQIKVFEEYFSNSYRYFMLFSHKKLFPEYISANITKYGYSQKQFCKLGLLGGMQLLHHKHLDIAIQLVRCLEKFELMIKRLLTVNDEIIVCGVKIRDNKKEYKPYLFKAKIIAVDDNNKPLFSFVECQSIATFYKESTSFYWIRCFTKQNDIAITRVYFSEGKKEADDLLNDKELAILQFIMQHKESQEIGQKLDFSTETVKKYRKKMIAKTGVKDTTALIQLAKLCNISRN